MVSDQHQAGRVAGQLEHDTRVSSGSKLKVVPAQAAKAKAGVRVGFSESFREQRYGLLHLKLPRGG